MLRLELLAVGGSALLFFLIKLFLVSCSEPTMVIGSRRWQ